MPVFGHYLFRMSYRPIQYKSVCSPQENYQKKGGGAHNPFFLENFKNAVIFSLSSMSYAIYDERGGAVPGRVRGRC
jgi:hypothetical protein